MRRISFSDIRLGEPVKQNIFDAHGALLLAKGQMIRSDMQATKLRDMGFVTDTNGKNGSLTDAESDYLPPLVDSSPVIIDDAYYRLEFLFNHLHQINDLPERVQTIAKEIRRACSIDTDKTISSIFLVLGRSSRYVIRHPIAVAIVSCLLAPKHALTEGECISLMCAALTMNISMVDLQELLYHQAAPLTARQKETIKSHPEVSVQLLKKFGVTDRYWLKSILEHHENLDGSGYPYGLEQNQISSGGQILLFADHYCAKISPRSYRKGVLPDAVLRGFFLNSKHLVRADMANAYIKTLGIYPPGSFVELTNGEIALVVRRGKTINCPIVQVVKNSAGMIDGMILRDTSNERFAILNLMTEEESGIDINPWQILKSD